MTDWTSISVTEEQKAELKENKPDNQAMGKYLLALKNGADPRPEQVDTAEIVQAVREELDRGDAGKDAQVLTDRLVERLKGFDEDVEQAAFRGAKRAIEEAR